jgi:L-ascorbate metabolism protein UlaG (beta-lactamase superfamily)
MIAALLFILFCSIMVAIFLQQPKFGKTPVGKRLQLIKQSPHYKKGKFENLSYTPDLTEGATYYSVIKKFFFEKRVRPKPSQKLPSAKTNLLQLSKDENVLVWFGHSSYYMQADGKTFLVDPVLSGAASPIKFTTRSFDGADVYTVDELPAIDYLIITHDHWDHLDYETIIKLKPRISKVICGLGVGEHFEHWGFNTSIISEHQWYETIQLEDHFTMYTTPARHFSGRGFSRNKSMWMSYVLQTPSLKIFIGGDSGYDTHFERTGAEHGPFDLAILECGQYDKSWRYIHTLPDEIIKVVQALKAKKLMPVHWGKFQLANHPWDEPILKISELARLNNIELATPLIGEAVYLKEEKQIFTPWWRNING